jgi:sugar-specific transcriptional regulator TrmB
MAHDRQLVNQSVRELRLKGFTLKEIAAELNKQKLYTAKGNPWTVAIVGHYGLRHQLIARVRNTKAGKIGSTGSAIQGRKRRVRRSFTEGTRTVIRARPNIGTDFKKISRNARLIAEIAESNLSPTTKKELISVLQ